MASSHARLLGLALLAVLAGTWNLRADDYFEQKKKELALQAQKMVADVTTALETSRSLEKTDAAKAKALLEQRLLDVSDSNSLDETQRADLRRRLLDRLKQVNATASEQKSSSDYQAQLAAQKAERAERERMDKAKEGQQKAPYDAAKDRIEGTKKTLESYDSLKMAREKGATDIELEVWKTASKMNEERFTDYFIKKSELRKTKLTKEETALLKALNSTISVDFKDNSLKEVLEYIDAKTNGQVNIFLDQASMKEAGVDYDSKVTFKANKVKLRTVLKKIFGDLQLTYVIKEGAIQVITPDHVKDFLVARAYPVADLITPFNDLRYSPGVKKAIMYQQAQQLMLTIVNTIEPASWQGVGENGYGTISYNEATGTIIIRHTAEMHYMLGGGLAR